MELLKEYISILLKEKRQPGIGPPKTSRMMQELSKYIDNGYFFHLSNINKLGINPKSSFNTPLGIYGYELTQNRFDEFKTKRLPFAEERLYVHIFRPAEKNTILNIDNYSEEDYKFDREELKKTEVKNEIEQEAKDFTRNKTPYSVLYDNAEFSIENYENDSKWPDSPIGKMWNVSRKIANNSKKWARILEKLGYTGVYDSGHGIIHQNEPEQIVIFRKEFLEHVATFDNLTSTSKDFLEVKHINDIFRSLEGEELLYAADKLAKQYGRSGHLSGYITDPIIKIGGDIPFEFLSRAYPKPFLKVLVRRISYNFENITEKRLKIIKNVNPIILDEFLFALRIQFDHRIAPNNMYKSAIMYKIDDIVKNFGSRSDLKEIKWFIDTAKELNEKYPETEPFF